MNLKKNLEYYFLDQIDRKLIKRICFVFLFYFIWSIKSEQVAEFWLDLNWFCVIPFILIAEAAI
jgi:hypothetical protein